MLGHVPAVFRVLILTVLTVSATISLSSPSHAADWQAGFAKEVITPTDYMWMSGYGGRTGPAEAKRQDLFAKVAALQPGDGQPLIVICTDLITVPAGMAAYVSEHLQTKHGIPRSHVMLTCSHTHCGPALNDRLSHMLAMQEDDWGQVRAYQKWLNAKLIELCDEAIQSLRPAELTWGNGRTDFAVNRRPPIGEGPVDHAVPVLLARDPKSRAVQGVIFGYACHNTTLSFNEWCGDYAGFAQAYVEDRYPDAVAMFYTGCGADQNPLPRRTVELAEKYGRMLGTAVEKVVEANDLKPLPTKVAAAFQDIPLSFANVPSREELQERLTSTNRFEQNRAKFLLAESEATNQVRETYPVPVQVWKFDGGPTWIAIGGEVVVDYSLRLKKIYGEDSTWVTGYANDVMGYVPSERVLKEGGYEGGSSMLYYQQPSAWASGLEERIVNTVAELIDAKSP